MLAEWALYLATPASLAARRTGALREAVGLWSRARRCRAAWKPHEQETRAAFERAIDEVPERRRVAVLGSGLLRDVPIERLSQAFGEVLLIDVVHLVTVRAAVRLKGLRNVTFVTRDISGFDELVERERIRAATGQEHIGGRLDPLAFLRRMPELDLVLSANLLSQIGVGAVRRLAALGEKAALLPPDLPARLVAAHLDSLATLPCRTVLVTDVFYEVRDRAGRIVDAADLLHGVLPPAPEAEWGWTVAPFGEEARDRERIHRVIAAADVAHDLG